jgi:hypothetical protein
MESAAERRKQENEKDVRTLVNAARPDPALRGLMGKIAEADQEVARAKVEVLLAADHELIDLDKAECFSAKDKAMILDLVANDQPQIVALVASLIRDNVCQSAVHDPALWPSGGEAVDLSDHDLEVPSTLLAFAAWLRTERPTITHLTLRITTPSCTFLRRALIEGILPHLRELRLNGESVSDEARAGLGECCAAKCVTVSWRQAASISPRARRSTDCMLVLKSMGFSDAIAANALTLVQPPSDAEQLREWYRRALRAQHTHISDALSGRRLDALHECVRIQLAGVDPSGAPLDVRDAEGLSAWLLKGGVRGLLTAGPAAGKTWLLSQLIMHLLNRSDAGERMPILVKAEYLQKQILEHSAAFTDDGSNWIDVSLRLEHGEDSPLYRMLREAMAERRALLLIDGLDEAGTQRERIERHVASALAPQGHALLCTSRPAGLGEALFARFDRLSLSPLSDAQQHTFLVGRLGRERADELKPYVRDKVPRDAETGQRVTANPLMLSMVASIAELRTGLEMPTTSAELYEVAARAMLGQAPPEVQALMRDTFFEAHAAGQRIITAAHLEAAAERTGRAGAVDELRRLVLSDRLPLMRLLAAEPLEMQAFHLSFQEFYAMRAVSAGGARLPGFRWSAWWTNAVLMGVVRAPSAP